MANYTRKYLHQASEIHTYETISIRVYRYHKVATKSSITQHIESEFSSFIVLKAQYATQKSHQASTGLSKANQLTSGLSTLLQASTGIKLQYATPQATKHTTGLTITGLIHYRPLQA